VPPSPGRRDLSNADKAALAAKLDKINARLAALGGSSSGSGRPSGGGGGSSQRRRGSSSG
jgi:hypothetical protein